MRALSTQHSTLRPLTVWIKRKRSPQKLAARLLLVWWLCVFAQDPATTLAQEKDQATHPAEPTITFDLYWEAADPQSYIITVKSSGEAKYVSRSPTRLEPGSQEADPEYMVEFTLSPANRDRMFTLAKQANYFNGDFDFKHKVANTGKKTLIYADPIRSFQTTFNYPANKDVEEITRLFQGISGTIEHGRKLQFMRRFNKLGLDAELKGMEQMAQEGYLAEIQIIAPLLQSIANDSSVLHMARQRAERLLAPGGSR